MRQHDCSYAHPPDRKELVGDAFTAISVFSIVLLCGSFTKEPDQITALGVVSSAALCLPLVYRRRWPYAVLVLTTLALLPAMEVLDGTVTVAIAPMIALYTVANLMPARAALLAAGKLTLVAIVATALFAPHPLLAVETLKNIALVILPVAVGMSLRERRIAVEALRERAERAEATREEEALRRVGEERLRIAREVHDVVAHALVAINVQAGVGAHLAERRPEAGREALTEIKRVSGEALGDLRATLGVLRSDDAPAPTRPTPSLSGVEDLADRVRAAGIAVDLDVRERGGCVVPSAVAAAGYRIVQEALTNVLRHARDARHVAVRVDAGGETLEIEVLDDGAGARSGAGGSGNGLRGMRERALAVGGRLDAGERPEGGWRVAARLPLPVGGAAA